MKALTFHAGALPDGFTLNVESSIFNQPAHLSLQSSSGWRSYYLLDPEEQRAEARIHLHVQDSKATSPLRASFGSVEFSDAVSSRALYEFIGLIEDDLTRAGVTTVIIKNPPVCYNPSHQSLLQVVLFNRGYTVCSAEPATYIAVSDQPYQTLIASMEKRKLKMAGQQQLTCRLMPRTALNTVYQFIEHHMQARGYPLSMNYTDLKNTVDQFPENFFLRGVFTAEDQLIAASIAIRVNAHVLYSFYIVHDKAYHKLSPVVVLAESLYAYCQQHGIPLLDLSTASLNNKPNFPLLEFKIRLGASVSEKLTFTKTLA